MWLSVKLLDFFQPIATHVEQKTRVGPQQLASFVFSLIAMSNFVTGDYRMFAMCVWFTFHSFVNGKLIPNINAEQDHSVGSRVARYGLLVAIPFILVLSDSVYTKIEIVLCFAALNFMCCSSVKEVK